MFKCRHCGHVLTQDQIKNAHFVYLEQCFCPSCERSGSLISYVTKLELTWELKVLIDVAINMGIVMTKGLVPDYSNYDYYEELIELANNFLNTPADPTKWYLEAVDDFAEKELLKKVGGAGNEV